MSKLSLGTVQFGLNYGISNKNGKIKLAEAKKILQLAKDSNINLIDTAISYGDSEKVIGDTGIKDFKFVSKLPSFPNGYINIDAWVEENVKSSIKRLGINSLYGLLIHKTENLLDNNGKKLISCLNRMKNDGLVKKIGISIYDPSECEKIFNLMKIDIVQAPLNIMDRRLVESGWLSKLNSQQVEIHTRSVFLQGLLLMSRDSIPNYFNRWSKIWDQWELELKKKNLDPIEVCLSYVLSLPEIDHIIVGVDNVYQLKDIFEKSKSKIPQIDSSFMISNDQMLINPTNWYKL
jgi:aryl-alcohol dehydrogenase-like predicted oxidoreductase